MDDALDGPPLAARRRLGVEEAFQLPGRHDCQFRQAGVEDVATAVPTGPSAS